MKKILQILFSFLLLTQLNFAQWTQLTEIPTARTFAASCEVDSKIYVLGGTGSTNTNGSGTRIMDVYDPILNSWDTTKTGMPTGRVELGVCAVNGKIYAIGGSANHSSSPLGTVEEYNPLTDNWETNKTPMPTPRKGAAVGVIDNKIYVAGGTAVTNFTASNKLEIYDPVTNTWDVTKEPMLQAMYQPQGAVINNTFYVIGGLLGSSPWTGQKIVQMYDPITDTWSYRADLNEGRVGHTTNVIDGKIYAIGGDKQPPPIRTVEEYNPNLDSWTVIDSTPSVMVCHTTSVVENKIYVISGSTSPIHPNLNLTNDVFSYQVSKHAQLLSGSFEFEGRTRNYEVYLPAELKENMPLILSLHGYSEDFKWYRDYTQLHVSTDTAGYILVCPQAAINLTWNIGILEDPDGIRDFSKVKDVNDVGFISTLIDTICKNYSIDMKRIYCCGFSTGGEMSLVLACCLGHRFAAVASVAGGLYDPAASWNPCKPMPVLEIHGTSESRYSPYDGRGSMWSVAKTLNYWVERNKITDPPEIVPIPDIVTSDNCTVEKISYTGGLNESEVIHYKVIGGGHSWPGSKTSFGTEGNKNRDISANVEILKFFNKFENPYYNTANPKSFDISPIYIKPEGDTVAIKANLVNPDNHSVVVYGVITGEDKNFEDSLQLFDDGLHNDVNASDNIFGGSKWYDGLEEDFYKIKIRATDLEDSLTSYSHFNFTKYFTTAGPLTVDSITYSALSDFEYGIKPIIKNDGTTVPVSNIQVKIFSDDPWVVQVGPSQACPDISPGEIKTVSRNFVVSYDSVAFPGYFNLKFEISSNGIPYWTDSLITIVTGWTLQPSDITTTLFDVCLTDANTGTAVGADGIILRTTNGGSTWETQASGTTYLLRDVCFTNANSGIVLGSDLLYTVGIILRTTNGGDTWMSKSSGYLLNAVSFTDTNIGTAVGEHGIILRTTDGGLTWESQSGGSTECLNSVFFSDASTGTVVGSNGIILRTTNGGSTWESQASGTTEWLSSVFFIDASIGIVVGWNGIILRTTNGGENWRLHYDNAACDYKDVHFIDSDQGTIVAGSGFGGDMNGEILHTTDGGATWMKQIVDYPGGFWSVFFSDANHGIIVGSDGIILRSTTGEVTWVEEKPRINEQIPEYFNLLQNYPNPFNPSTKIRYSIPKRSNVVIKVYDILGKEVITLVNEEKQTGSHELTWNASNFSSGVYFYQLRAGDFIGTKKMILLK